MSDDTKELVEQLKGAAAEVAASQRRVNDLARAVEDSVRELRAACKLISRSPTAQVTKELEAIPALREAFLVATRPAAELELEKMKQEALAMKLGAFSEIATQLGPGFIDLLNDKRLKDAIVSRLDANRNAKGE